MFGNTLVSSFNMNKKYCCSKTLPCIEHVNNSLNFFNKIYFRLCFDNMAYRSSLTMLSSVYFSHYNSFKATY